MTNKMHANTSRSLWVAFLIGFSLMAAVDEIVFHQILAWHHFYDQSTTEVALLSDGFLHVAELTGLIAGFFLFADLRHSQQLAPKWAWAGFFYGLGGFQLFDGIIDHKILRLHQVRYVENLYVYDLVWNLWGIILLLIGFWLNRRAKNAENFADTAH
ncbi:MAG: DUF2243 domain-containing protein [Anditalea sp.]